ncbi:MAG: MFS transporter, partial [Pseudomonadota bacterium]|nr:MFS transporter [Pseudomonadota bacterium]
MDPRVQVIRSRIDNGPMTSMMFIVIGIGFLLNLVDGFDVVAMSVAGPSITADWGISDGEKGWILSSALIGMAIGAAFLAPYSDVIGRRKLILFATALIGTSMIVTGFIPESVGLMMAIRVVSGLGIGVIMAAGAAIASEFAPDRYRNIAVTTVVMGYPFGAMVVGPIANWIIPVFGWEMLFVFGGLATLMLGGIFYFILPESLEYLATRKSQDDQSLDQENSALVKLKREPLESLPPAPADIAQSGSVSALMQNGFALPTWGIWAIYFLGFLTMYFLLSWIPSLFVDAGYTRSQGIFALTLFNAGAVIGIVSIGVISTGRKIAKPISIFFVVSAALLAFISQIKPDSLTALNAGILVIGLFFPESVSEGFSLSALLYRGKVAPSLEVRSGQPEK